MKKTNVTKYISTALAAVVACVLALPAQAEKIVDFAFGEGTGTATANTGSATVNGTLIGNAAWSTDTVSDSGYSLNLPGLGEGDRVASQPGGPVAKLDGLTNLTVAMWMKVQPGLQLGDRLLSNAGATGTGIDMLFQVPATGSLSPNDYKVQVYLDGVVSHLSHDIEEDGWVFIAYTYSDAEDRTRFYTGTDSRGVAQLGGTQLGITAPGALGAGSTLVIGNTDANLAKAPAALFDNVQIYSRELTSTELEAVRVAGGGVSPPPDLSEFVQGTPVAIDGAYDAKWSAAEVYTNFFTTVGGAPDDAADLSAKLRAMWDADNLYVLVEVSDESHILEAGDSWDDDSIEIYIDVNDEDRAYTSGDTEIFQTGCLIDLTGPYPATITPVIIRPNKKNATLIERFISVPISHPEIHVFRTD